MRKEALETDTTSEKPAMIAEGRRNEQFENSIENTDRLFR
ncbi:Protein of unknown function [Pyronema omphalodes CBS 100304]|uniref:Uncharacterized protein n=1 Tax=Pyronema omphalodes (strain CBS 100304) TaxID=1076935 RepID=U4KWJ1_PYROM|nr:Protein of unknown function [Pyronema omphalodes CBS 100304]